MIQERLPFHLCRWTCNCSSNRETDPLFFRPPESCSEDLAQSTQPGPLPTNELTDLFFKCCDDSFWSPAFLIFSESICSICDVYLNCRWKSARIIECYLISSAIPPTGDFQALALVQWQCQPFEPTVISVNVTMHLDWGELVPCPMPGLPK